MNILGLGTASPDFSISQESAAAFALQACGGGSKRQRVIHALYEQTNIRRRHTVIQRCSDEEGINQDFFPMDEAENLSVPTTRQRMERYRIEAPRLATNASREALEQSGLSPTEVTHLVTVSCTGFLAPGVDVHLINNLGLPAGIERTHVGFMGCHGALNGVRVAGAFARMPGAAVLVCAVELCSLHFHFGWDRDALVANSLFADGAAALVGVNGAADAAKWRWQASGSQLFPNSESALTWTVGDHGFSMTLSSQVPDLIEQHLRPAVERWLTSHDLTLDQIRTWAVHPGGPRIVDAVESALSLPPKATDTSRQVLADYGNMSSPTILFIMQRLMAADAPRPCVALGFGPGLVAEFALFR